MWPLTPISWSLWHGTCWSQNRYLYSVIKDALSFLKKNPKNKKNNPPPLFLFKLWTLCCWFFNFLIFLTLKTPSCNKNNIRSLRLLEITLQWSNITFWFTKTLHMSPDLFSLHKKSCRNSSVWTVKSHFLLKGNESLTVEVSPFF